MTREELNKILVEHHFKLISEHNNKRATTYTYTCSISYLNRFIIFNVQNGSDDIYIMIVFCMRYNHQYIIELLIVANGKEYKR